MKEKKFEFANEGVMVAIPAQTRNLRAVKRPVGSMADMHPKPGGFNPIRLVFNFEVEDEDQPGTFVSEFEQPLELRVRYNAGDQEKARAADKKLRLGFWDGSQWIVFDESKHKFQIVPHGGSAAGGELVVFISRWSDPPIGIGI
ncbi:MAG: hypothetical protein ACWGO1_01925 [Anaerolineales bacterium]